MSDRYAWFCQTWRPKLQSVFNKHLPSLLRIDLKVLYDYSKVRHLLDRGESDKVWDATKPAEERIVQLVHFVCCDRSHNGSHKLERFIECLSQGGYKELADALTKDLHVKPEDVVNQLEYRRRKKREYAKLYVSIKGKFRQAFPEMSPKFEEFQTFAAECISGHEDKLAIHHAATVDSVFSQLSAGEHITETNTDILHELLQYAYDTGDNTFSDDRHGLKQFDLRNDFEEFSLKVVHYVAERATAVQIKICILSTPVRFGWYYAKLENEQEVSIIIKILRDWEHPELLHRIVRHFCPPEDQQRLDQYRAEASEPDRSTIVQKEHVKHREDYADTLIDVHSHLQEHPQSFLDCVVSLTVSKAHPTLKLITVPVNTVSDALLALLPFSSCYNTSLLSYIVNNFCDVSLQDRWSFNMKQWEDSVASHVTISDIYDVQLDRLPLQLTERKIALLVLHLEGEMWKKPIIKLLIHLGLSTADHFALQPWSVVYYRTVITGQETDRKGDCKVEYLVPALAACIIMKDGPSKQEFFHKHSITYLEVIVRDDCHLTGDSNSIEHMYESAQRQQYFAPYVEELNNTP